MVFFFWWGGCGPPHSSVGKESACSAGDPSSIPGSWRSAGEGIGYPLQCSWASFVAQLEENPPAMWETFVRSLGWEDPLEKGRATHSSILAWRIPWTICSPWSHKELDTSEQLNWTGLKIFVFRTTLTKLVKMLKSFFLKYGFYLLVFFVLQSRKIQILFI